MFTGQHDVVCMQKPELRCAHDHPGRQGPDGAAQMAQPGEQADFLGRGDGDGNVATQ